MARHSQAGLWVNLPLFINIMIVASMSTYVPAIHALIRDDHVTSRAFFYSGTLGLIVLSFVVIVLAARRAEYGFLDQLLSLLAAYIFVPLFLSVPVYESLETTSFLDLYVDMISAMTTTGGNFVGDLGILNPTLHLWRAQVAWLGGLLMWIVAAAVFAPLSLGGFEVTARSHARSSADTQWTVSKGESSYQVRKVIRILVPTYVLLTVLLWLGLTIAGENSLVAVIHAMSTMATSGLSPIDGLIDSKTGIPGEIIMAIFMLFALSRLTFSSEAFVGRQWRLFREPEFKIGVSIVFLTSVLLFVRHWIGSSGDIVIEELPHAMRAFWGHIFTVLSFLSTTGFVSAEWSLASDWSGFKSPGLILMGLAIIGGGVATTAGGIKLLRIYVLYLNGLREIERLIHPSSVPGKSTGRIDGRQSRAFIAWIFVMLFTLSLAIITVLLTLLGGGFEDAILLTIASLSTTGPLIDVVSEGRIQLVELSTAIKLVLAGAMVLGRIETLAIIALMSVEAWRR
ncbi:MAG: TrkH family potassium uptake protein [Aestuariivita sp.]|nr:TrkH family potassium uptake protein [Aestuariivita sp.]